MMDLINLNIGDNLLGVPLLALGEVQMGLLVVNTKKTSDAVQTRPLRVPPLQRGGQDSQP